MRADIAHSALALGPPAARERAAAGNRDEADIARHQVAIAIPRSECHDMFTIAFSTAKSCPSPEPWLLPNKTAHLEIAM